MSFLIKSESSPENSTPVGPPPTTVSIEFELDLEC